MSVINQMLRELNQRRAPEMQKGSVPLFTQPVAPRHSSWQLAIALLILFVIILTLWWHFYASPIQHIQQREFETLVQRLERVSESQNLVASTQPVVTAPARPAQSENLTPLPQPVTHETYLELPISPAVTKKNTPQQVQPQQTLDLPAEETQIDEIESKVEIEEDAVVQQVVAKEPVAPEKQKTLVIKRTTLSAAEEISLLKEQLTLAAKDPKQQIILLRRMLDIDPHLHEQRTHLATLLQKSARYDDAKTLLAQGIALYPDIIEIRLELASLMLFLGEMQNAFALLSQVQAKTNDFPIRFYALRALTAMKINALHDAVLMYEHLVQKEPEKARWWLGLAAAREQQRDRANALDAYRNAQRLGITHQRTQQVVEQRILALEATP